MPWGSSWGGTEWGQEGGGGLGQYRLLLALTQSDETGAWHTVVPDDNGSYSGTTVTIPPPSNVSKGDLILMIGLWRDPANSAPIWPATPQVTGGQSWLSIGNEVNGSGVSMQRYMCEFNGTWSADPVIGPSGVAAAAMIGFMQGFLASSPTKRWLMQSEASTFFSDTVAPFDLTWPSQPITRHNTVCLIEWHRDALHTFTLQTGPWDNPNNEPQWRNLSAGLSLSVAFRYITSPIVNSGAVTNTTDGSSFFGGSSYMAFYEVPRKTQVIVKSQANRRKSRW
jgi:hypothetical protein